MHSTLLTFFLIPPCLFWAMKPVRLLQIMLIASIFEAAAAVAIGSVGVQPCLVPAVLFLGYTVLQLLLGVRYPGGALTWQLARPFVLVVAWAIASSIILPRLLEGQVYVWPQKSEPPFVMIPLAPTQGNLNQDVYLIINCSLVILTSMFLSNTSLRLRPLINTYLFTGYLVAGVALWQFASKVAHLPFPDDLFYSNPGWAILTTQQIGTIPRINGSFAEPSALATYMSAIVCSAGWLLIQGHKGSGIRWLLIVSLLTIMLSTSSTGIAVLAIIGCGVPLFALLTGSTRLIAGIMNIGIPLFLVLGLAGIVIQVVEPEIFTKAQEIIDTTAEKQDSSSYHDRTAADVDSLNAFVDSFGLGTGWGSNRSSSLLPGLLSAIGIPGVVGLVWFGIIIGRNVSRVRRLAAVQDQLFVLDACCGGLVGYLLSGVISAPTISSVSFFFLLAMLIAAIARIDIDFFTRARLAHDAASRNKAASRELRGKPASVW